VKQVLPRSGVGEMVHIMYTHVTKCKNDKIKFLKIGKGPNIGILHLQVWTVERQGQGSNVK
jgi:hypothetical protein